MLGTTFDLLLVIIGFGLIVFVHELGHFIAARWAGIRVLAFAVGFGPAVLSFRKGMGVRVGSSEKAYLDLASAEFRGNPPRGTPRFRDISPTEYRLNLLPCGGYVKMLGQEDGNPEAVSDATDSYQSCKPWKRMIVISAGVVMNIITAIALFIFVFMVGMKVEPARVGAVMPGSPAALAPALNAGELNITRPGLAPGDIILSINGEKPNSFSDLMAATAMAKRNSLIDLTVSRPGVSKPLAFAIRPETSPASGMLEIGIDPTRSPTILSAADPKDSAAFIEGMKSLGLDGVEPGMTLTKVNGQEVTNGTALFTAIHASRGEPISADFQSATKTVQVQVVPRPQLQLDYLPRGDKVVTPIDHLLGLTPVMTVGPAPADPALRKGLNQDLKPGDIFARLGGVEYPNIAQGIAEIKANKGRTLPVVVLRRNERGELTEVSLPKVPVNANGQIGFNYGDLSKDAAVISAPLPTMVHPGTTTPFTPPAAGVFNAPGTRIISINESAIANFADLRAALRTATATALAKHDGATVTVHFRRPTAGILTDEAPIEEVQWSLPYAHIAALHGLNWQTPVSPGIFKVEQTLLKAATPGDAIRMGLTETKRYMLTAYATFARLYEGTLKIEALKGPVGIAHIGTLVANQGIIRLLFFLALISVNLAVINFLPLPIVDGGQFLFILFEQLRGKPVPIAVQSAATLAGLVLIGCIFLVVTFNDIKNLFGL